MCYNVGIHRFSRARRSSVRILFLLLLLLPTLAYAQNPPDIVLDFRYGYHIEKGTQLDITHLVIRSSRIPRKKNVIYTGVEIFSSREDQETHVAISQGSTKIDCAPLSGGYATLQDNSGKGVDTISFSGRADLNRIIVHLGFSDSPAQPTPPTIPAPSTTPDWSNDLFPHTPPHPPTHHAPKNDPLRHDKVIKDYIKSDSNKEVFKKDISRYTRTKGFSDITLHVDSSHYPLSVNQVLIIDKAGQQQWTTLSRRMNQGMNILGVAIPQGAQEIRLSMMGGDGAHIIVSLHQ